MNRRQFLGLFAAAPTVSLLSQCAHSSFSGQRFVSQSGRLEAQLTARAQTHRILTASGYQSARFLSYNGQVPGPTLQLRPGDTVRLTLNNQLNRPTNLHYHGLHLSPAIDNVFREVPAGESYTYEFEIPQNHPAVTGWYHPHYHLNVAPQVAGGLAGPLIVRADLDEIPELQQAQEALLVLQDFNLSAQGEPVQPHPLARMWGREGNLLLVNGEENPVVDLPQNGLLRLRLLNASASRIYRLQLRQHPWYLMATDRGSIASPAETDSVTLSPGERAELLVNAVQEPGDYEILSLPYDRGTGEMMAAMGERIEQMAGVVRPQQTAIATLRYRPSDRLDPLPMPQRLIAPEPLPKPERIREFVLNHGLDAEAGSTGFVINQQSFVMDRINTRVKLGAVEDWRIINKASIDHPFHLHTNRFQVVSRNAQPETLLAWKDTVTVAGYETVTIRVRFEDFTGRTVYHCHILDHEDQGMMGILEIS